MIAQFAAIDITEAAFLGLIVATIQFATLMYLAALGETIAERSGVLNLGVEGMMAVGAVCGYIGAVSTGSPWLGLLIGALAGAAVSPKPAIAPFVAAAAAASSAPASPPTPSAAERVPFFFWFS